MATRIYETALGDQHKDVTEDVGSAITAGKAVAVTVDMAVCVDKQQAIEALEKVIDHIHEGVWLPA